MQTHTSILSFCFHSVASFLSAGCFLYRLFIFLRKEVERLGILLPYIPFLDAWPYLAFNLQSKRENYGMVNSMGIQLQENRVFASFMYISNWIDLQPIHIAYDTHWLKHIMVWNGFLFLRQAMKCLSMNCTSVFRVVIFLLLTFCFSMIKYSQCSPLLFLKYFHKMCRINRYISVIFNGAPVMRLKFEMNRVKEKEKRRRKREKNADRKIKPSISMSSFILFRSNEALSIAMAICAKIVVCIFSFVFHFECVTWMNLFTL